MKNAFELIRLNRARADKGGYTLLIAVLSCVIALGFSAAVLTAGYGSLMRTKLIEKDEQLRLYAISGAGLIRDGLEGSMLIIQTEERCCVEDSGRNAGEAISGDIIYTGSDWVRRLLSSAYVGEGSLLLTAETDAGTLEWDCTAAQLGRNSTGIPDESSPLTIDILCRRGESEIHKTLTAGLSKSISSYTVRRQLSEGGADYSYIYTYRTYCCSFGSVGIED